MRPRRAGLSATLGIIAFAAVILGPMVGSLFGRQGGFAGMGVGFCVAMILVLVVLLLQVLKDDPRGSLPMVALRIAVVVVAFAAPVAAPIAWRLSLKGCVVLNIFGLTWPADVVAVVQPVCFAVVLASTTALIIATRSPQLRRTAKVMWAYTGTAAIPVLILMFLSVYGDPAPGCIPV